MSNDDDDNEKKASKEKDEELDRLARQMLLEEAKRNKTRADIQGALGWQKPKLVTNRKFLCNTLIANAVHNIHRNEREREQRRKSDQRRSRSRTPSPSSKRKRK